jgi:hypothetical protein
MFSENEFRTASSKGVLYPDGYGGKSLYPPEAYMSVAADNMVWMTPEELHFKTGDVYKAILGFRTWYDFYYK